LSDAEASTLSTLSPDFWTPCDVLDDARWVVDGGDTTGDKTGDKTGASEFTERWTRVGLGGLLFTLFLLEFGLLSSTVQVRAVNPAKEAVLCTEEGWLLPGRLWRKMENGVEDSPLPEARSKVALLIRLLT
jgi:hypothetical protein